MEKRQFQVEEFQMNFIGSHPSQVGLNSPSLRCGESLVICFEIAKYRKEKKTKTRTLEWRNLADLLSARGSMTSSVLSHVGGVPRGLIGVVLHLSGLTLPNSHINCFQTNPN